MIGFLGKIKSAFTNTDLTQVIRISIDFDNHDLYSPTSVVIYSAKSVSYFLLLQTLLSSIAYSL